MSENEKLAELFFDNSISFGKVLWLAGFTEDKLPDYFEDDFATNDSRILSKVLGIDKKEIDSMFEDADEDEHDFAVALYESIRSSGKYGFLVEVLIPNMIDVSTYYGHTLNWFYTESLNLEFGEKVVAFAKKKQAKKKAEILRDKGGAR